jgi:D-sedoheptulose 7-phosphate isomerase
MNESLLEKYFDEYRSLLFSDDVKSNVKSFAELARQVRSRRSKIMFFGNGASASISEHGAVDFTKQAKVRGVTFHDPNLITCFANDFGYENWMSEAIAHYGDEGDAVVLISTSGQSPSVLNAARKAKDLGFPVVTFSGRNENNSLRALGDINFWVSSNAYNICENLHSIWLTATIDLVIGKAEYETRTYSL